MGVTKERLKEPTYKGALGFLLVLFQLRIYAGLIISVLNHLNLYFTYGRWARTIYIAIDFAMFACLVICLVLFYSKRLAFRIWYAAAVLILCGKNFFSDNMTVAIVSTVLEILIVLALFTSKRLPNRFRSKMKVKEKTKKAA